MTSSTSTANGSTPDPRKDSLIEYPSQFPIKVMGLKQDGFVHAVTDIAHRFDPRSTPAASSCAPAAAASTWASPSR